MDILGPDRVHGQLLAIVLALKPIKSHPQENGKNYTMRGMRQHHIQWSWCRARSRIPGVFGSEEQVRVIHESGKYGAEMLNEPFVLPEDDNLSRNEYHKANNLH